MLSFTIRVFPLVLIEDSFVDGAAMFFFFATGGGTFFGFTGGGIFSTWQITTQLNTKAAVK